VDSGLQGSFSLGCCVWFHCACEQVLETLGVDSDSSTVLQSISPDKKAVVRTSRVRRVSCIVLELPGGKSG
jgi:hypothetical protein